MTMVEAPKVQSEDVSGAGDVVRFIEVEETSVPGAEVDAYYSAEAIEADHARVVYVATMHTEADLDAAIRALESLRAVVKAAVELRGEV